MVGGGSMAPRPVRPVTPTPSSPKAPPAQPAVLGAPLLQALLPVEAKHSHSFLSGPQGL